MPNTKRIEAVMSVLLTLGTLTAIVCVGFGGLLYLHLHGMQLLPSELMQANAATQQSNNFVFNSFPLHLIAIGLLVLVGTQLLRVFLLAMFYLYTRDYLFTLISFFVLSILLYSLIWQS